MDPRYQIYKTEQDGAPGVYGDINGAHPKRLHPLEVHKDTSFSLKSTDIEGAAPGTKGNKYLMPKNRKDFRVTNKNDDVVGAQPESLKRGMRTNRVVNPADPVYKLSEDSGIHSKFYGMGAPRSNSSSKKPERRENPIIPLGQSIKQSRRSSSCSKASRNTEPVPFTERLETNAPKSQEEKRFSRPASRESRGRNKVAANQMKLADIVTLKKAEMETKEAKQEAREENNGSQSGTSASMGSQSQEMGRNFEEMRSILMKELTNGKGKKQIKVEREIQKRSFVKQRLQELNDLRMYNEKLIQSEIEYLKRTGNFVDEKETLIEKEKAIVEEERKGEKEKRVIDLGFTGFIVRGFEKAEGKPCG